MANATPATAARAMAPPRYSSVDCAADALGPKCEDDGCQHCPESRRVKTTYDRRAPAGPALVRRGS
jgi:hypothetical protein